MSVIVVLLVVSLLMAAGFLGAFLWATRSGQFDDTCTPPMRVVSEEEEQGPARKQGAADTSSPGHADQRGTRA